MMNGKKYKHSQHLIKNTINNLMNQRFGSLFSLELSYGEVAQLVESQIEALGVVGSIPSTSTNTY